MDVHGVTPVGPLPRAMGRVALGRLAREDLEALASLKLWSEVGVPFDLSREILAQASDRWIAAYLASLPCAIGAAPIDRHTLDRARARYSRRMSRARAPVETRDGDPTLTNLTVAA